MKKQKAAPKTPKDKAPNLYVKYSTLVIQMGLIIGLGTWLGDYLDEKRANEFPVYTLVLALFSVGAALYLILRDVLKNRS